MTLGGGSTRSSGFWRADENRPHLGGWRGNAGGRAGGLATRDPPRRSQAEPADVVVYGVPAGARTPCSAAEPDPDTGLPLGYLGGYIEALGSRAAPL